MSENETKAVSRAGPTGSLRRTTSDSTRRSRRRSRPAANDPSWPVGETRAFSIGLMVEVVKTNPGWIGGYSMMLTPTG